MLEDHPTSAVDSHTDRIEAHCCFVGLHPEHGEKLRGLSAEMTSGLPASVDMVYAKLRTVPELSAKLGSAENERRIRGMFANYVEQMFGGTYDAAYIQSRERIGVAHDRIGLGPHWFVGAYGHLFRDLILSAMCNRAGDVDAQCETLDALLRVMFLDLGLVLETHERTGLQRRQAMVGRFVSGLQQTTDSLSSTTQSVGGVVHEQQESVALSAAAIAEFSSSLSELRQTSSQSLEHANGLLEVVDDAATSVRSGTQAASATVDGLRAIREQVETIQGTIQALVEHTNQIGDIITTVNEIAEQSKLLALNASIEAARAGEYGRSFSVVANEMRDLAEQSKQATRQVRQLLSDISEATASAVIVTEDGLQQARDGEGLVMSMGAALQTIDTLMQRTEEASRLIANASRQQQAGVSQVADAMVSIDQTTGQTPMRWRISPARSTRLPKPRIHSVPSSASFRARARSQPTRIVVSAAITTAPIRLSTSPSRDIVRTSMRSVP